MRMVTQVVPEFAPVDGVGDHALGLGKWLRKQGWESRFLVCCLDWATPPVVDGFAVRKLKRHSPGDFSAALVADGETPVLLHYVGYGYQKRGVPDWLLDGIGHWRRGAASSKLITEFHEIWTRGCPPWKSAFWLWPWQRGVCRGLARASDHLLTSTRRHQMELQKLTQKPVERSPIPSNLPVTSAKKDCSTIAVGKLTLLIFGQTWSRAAAARSHAKLIAGLAGSDRLRRVVVAGKGSTGEDQGSDDVAVLRGHISSDLIEVKGGLGEQEAAGLFGEADLFLCAYPGKEACKSTVLMAALANGCPAVLADGAGAEPLISGTHFLECNGSPQAQRKLVEFIDQGGLGDISRAGGMWYHQTADWPIVAAGVARILETV